MNRFAKLIACLSTVLIPASGAAQAYPSKPIRLIVPFPAGGANDIIGREIAQKLTVALQQQVVVDNRGGANAIIGSDIAAKAAPDGYTILIVPSSHAINPAMYAKLPYDTLKDFAPVILIGPGAYVLVANPSLPIANTRELIALARSKPGELRFGSSGIGNVTHLAAELFMKMAGVTFLHVPYKGGGPALTELIGGQISIFFGTISVMLPQIKADRVRALAVTTAQRFPVIANIPTIAESGLPGYEVSGWYGIVAPARTPRPIIALLNTAIKKSLDTAEVKEKLLTLGVEATGSSPESFGAYIATELDRWRKLVTSVGIAVQS